MCPLAASRLASSLSCGTGKDEREHEARWRRPREVGMAENTLIWVFSNNPCGEVESRSHRTFTPDATALFLLITGLIGVGACFGRCHTTALGSGRFSLRNVRQDL